MSAFEVETVARDENERSFKVNGILFRVRPAMSTLKFAEFEDEHLRLMSTDDFNGVEIVKLRQQFVADQLENGQVDQWHQVLNDPTNPVNLTQLEQITNFVIRVVTGRPFERPADSGGSSATTSTTSTGGSPSTEPN